MRSSSGPGMVSSTLAVHTNSTCGAAGWRGGGVAGWRGGEVVRWRRGGEVVREVAGWRAGRWSRRRRPGPDRLLPGPQLCALPTPGPCQCANPSAPRPAPAPHLAQVDGHVQVVVQEAAVLLRVQQLQQRAGGVACGAGGQGQGAGERGPAVRAELWRQAGCARRGRHAPLHATSAGTRCQAAAGWLAQAGAGRARLMAQAGRHRQAGRRRRAPAWPRPNLSISSMSTSGLLLPVDLRHCTLLPGMAPT
jgi:hypothetical protein